MPKTKQEKQETVEQLKAARQSRTTQEQLDLIKQRRGKSMDETGRLLIRRKQEEDGQRERF